MLTRWADAILIIALLVVPTGRSHVSEEVPESTLIESPRTSGQVLRKRSKQRDEATHAQARMLLHVVSGGGVGIPWRSPVAVVTTVPLTQHRDPDLVHASARAPPRACRV